MRPISGARWCLFLSLIGIGLAGYIFYLHLGLMRGELVGGPACGSGAMNCHAVTSGVWGSFLGVPISLWGILGYFVFIGLSLLAWQSDEWASRAMLATFLLGLFAVAINAILLYMMVFVIGYYCLFCLLVDAVNLGLLAVAAASLGQPWARAKNQIGNALWSFFPSRKNPAAWLFWGIVIAGFLGVAAVHASTSYLARGSTGTIRKQMREFATKQQRISVDVTGDPAKGNPAGWLRIVEFSDFLCPACQRASKLNPIMLAGHRRDAVFIFKNYPLDTTCNTDIQRMVHPGACQVAAAGECAQQQGKFWEFHDLIFEKGHDYNLNGLEPDIQRLGMDLARFRGCMSDGTGMEAVKRDIVEAKKARVMSTPTYVINGLPIPGGGVNPYLFEDLVAVIKESGNG